MKLMTLEEVCLELKYKESSLTKNFQQTKKNLEKTGIILNKIGRGRNARFTVEYKIPEGKEEDDGIIDTVEEMNDWLK